VRGTFRVPAHGPVAYRPPFPNSTSVDEDEEDRFINRPCYEFNDDLTTVWNDRHCEHCRHYLTARCPHIDEFLDDVEDLTPE
jgi:ferredoxin-thioredoxin reductase catalytic subunit